MDVAEDPEGESLNQKEREKGFLPDTLELVETSTKRSSTKTIVVRARGEKQQIGIIRWSIESDSRPFINGKLGKIAELSVQSIPDEGVSQRDIQAALFESFQQALIMKNIRSVSVSATEEMAPFYQSLGFEPQQIHFCKDRSSFDDSPLGSGDDPITVELMKFGEIRRATDLLDQTCRWHQEIDPSQYWGDRVVHFAFLHFPARMAQITLQKYWCKDVVLLAKSEEGPVGLLIGEVGDDKAIIEEVYVATKGQGVGRKLMVHFERLVREAGCSCIELDATAKNPGAREFYLKVGYTIANQEFVRHFE